MAKNKNPMSLEDLPEYLKNARQHGEGGSPVVNTGQIVSTNTSSGSWFQTMALAFLMVITVSLGSFITYNAMSTKNIIINIDVANGNAEKISKIVTDGGGEVLSMEQKDEDTFEVKVATRKSRRSFLDWLRGNKDVQKAELEE